MIHALIEILAGLVALMAAAALSQFGVDLNFGQPDREVQRVRDCGDAAPSKALFATESPDC